MSDTLTSRVYNPDPAKCCSACVFGRGEHETWCAERVLEDIREFRSLVELEGALRQALKKRRSHK